MHIRPPAATILDRITEIEYASLLRFVRQYTYSFEEAQDVVQESFRIAIEKQDQLRDTEQLLPWLRTIARREALHQKQYYVRLVLASSADMAGFAATDDVEDAIQQQFLFRTVAKLMNRVAPVYGIILRKHYWEGLSFSEIASQLGMTAGTVRSYHKRILRRLCKALN